MATETPATAAGQSSQADYFDTDSRGQCVNLIIHLLHNTSEMPCLCGPRGLGKTSFARRLEALMREDFKVLWVPLKTGEELAPAVCRQLRLPHSHPPSDWQRLLDDLPDGRPLLVLVDDAERLSPNAQQAMLDMADAGIRFVLVGSGPPSPALKSHIREIDLPGFTLEETREFLSYLGRRAGVPVASLDAAKLYKTSQGRPGVIIEQMEGRGAPKSGTPKRGAGLRFIVMAFLLAGVVGLVLWFQDEINGLLGSMPGHDDYITELPLPPQMAPERSAVVLPPVADASIVVAAESPSPGAARATDEKAAPEVALPAVELGAMRPEAPHVPAEPVPVMARPPVQDEASTSTLEQPAVAQLPEPPAAQPAIEQVESIAQEAPERPVTPLVGQPSADDGQGGGDTWLSDQPADHFTLQLVGARERSAIDRFVSRYELPKPYGVFMRDLGGKPWYSLVWGSFPDRNSALAASRQLPPSVRKDVWPRDFGSIQAQLGR